MKTMQTLLLQALLLGLCINSTFGAWEMFSDGKDTYLYNTQSGDVYIRYNRGGKNYEDIFVKMPAGTLPSQLSPTKTTTKSLNTMPPTQPSAPNSNDESARLLEQQQQALQKSQELLRNSIDTSGILE